MEGTLEVLSQFHELSREKLRKLCGNDRAFSESVKMVAASDMTNFSAIINVGELVFLLYVTLHKSNAAGTKQQLYVVKLA